MHLYNRQGKRLHLTEGTPRPHRDGSRSPSAHCAWVCTGYRISEVLALTPKRIGKAVMFESLKKRRRGVYRAMYVPAPFDTLAMKRGGEHPDRPLWPCPEIRRGGTSRPRDGTVPEHGSGSSSAPATSPRPWIMPCNSPTAPAASSGHRRSVARTPPPTARRNGLSHFPLCNLLP